MVPLSWATGATPTVGLGHRHVDHLTAAGHEAGQGHAAVFDPGRLRRPHGPGELRDRQRIDAIGLGEPAAGARKVPDAARVDHRHCRARRAQALALRVIRA